MPVTEIKALLYATERNGESIYRIHIPSLLKDDATMPSKGIWEIDKSATA